MSSRPERHGSLEGFQTTTRLGDYIGRLYPACDIRSFCTAVTDLVRRTRTRKFTVQLQCTPTYPFYSFYSSYF